MSASVYRSITQDWSESEKKLFPETSFHFLESTTSTNTILRERIQKGEADHFTIVATDHQTAGRGRRGDRWEATPGSNLLFSIALELPDESMHWSRLPHLTAMCVTNAVESILTMGNGIKAKWPNDLYFDSRKLCGILVETISTTRPFAVVGIGLNVNMKHSDFPDELSEMVTSICEIEGCEANRWYLLSLILQGFLADYPSRLHHFDSVRDWYRRHDFLDRKSILVSAVSGTWTGRSQGIGENGELLLMMESGETEKIVSAEKIEEC